MQNIIDPSPQEKLFWGQVEVAGDSLIEIDKAEDQIEETHRLRPPGKDHQQSDQAENYVKHVVRRGAAGEAELWRNKRPGNASENQDWGENG